MDKLTLELSAKSAKVEELMLQQATRSEHQHDIESLMSQLTSVKQELEALRQEKEESRSNPNKSQSVMSKERQALLSQVTELNDQLDQTHGDYATKPNQLQVQLKESKSHLDQAQAAVLEKTWQLDVAAKRDADSTNLGRPKSMDVYLEKHWPNSKDAQVCHHHVCCKSFLMLQSCLPILEWCRKQDSGASAQGAADQHP